MLVCVVCSLGVCVLLHGLAAFLGGGASLGAAGSCPSQIERHWVRACCPFPQAGHVWSLSQFGLLQVRKWKLLQYSLPLGDGRHSDLGSFVPLPEYSVPLLPAAFLLPLSFPPFLLLLLSCLGCVAVCEVFWGWYGCCPLDWCGWYVFVL